MKKLLVGIDASRSNVKQMTGTEYYSYEIIKNLVNFDEVDFRLYSKSPLHYLPQRANLQKRVMKFPRLWSQIRLSTEILKNPPDVLFEPAHTIPLYHGKRTVVTLHDIGFKYFPALYTPLERFYHNFCMGFSAKHATKIIAVSEATKNDLIKVYRVEAKKIRVIYHGYDKTKYFPASKAAKVAPEIAKLRPYIYFIGRLEAKKNVKNLIKAFGSLRQDKTISHKLVLAGRPGYLYEEIKSEINRLPEAIRKDVIETGYIADEQVGEYMRFASIFAFPSYFEGFGMPLVEAMASGVPVVASDRTSIPEIVGSAGLMSSPDDDRDFANNLASVIKNKGLRSDLIEAGLKRAKSFDWKRCAHETLEEIVEVGRS